MISLALAVGGSEAPTVRIEPRFLEVSVGDPVEFRCVATGRPEPTLEWTGGRDGRLSPAHTFTNGVFRYGAIGTLTLSKHLLVNEKLHYCVTFNIMYGLKIG